MLQDNLIKILEESFRKYRGMPAITDYFTSEVFSYYTLALEVAKLHMLFEECGLKNGDKVAIAGRNNPRWVTAFVASITYGCTAVPIMQDLDMNDINHMVNESRARVLFAGDAFWDIIETESTPRLKAIFSLSDFHCIWERDGDRLSDYQRNILRHFNAKYPKGFDTDDIAYEAPELRKPAVICYTSGTTGFSKAVILTVGNLTSNVECILAKQMFDRDTRTLGLLPLGHIYGMVFSMLAPLAAGSHITLLGHMPSHKILLQALGGVHPHVICTVPHVMERIVRRELIRRAHNGATKLASFIPAVNALIDPAVRKILLHMFGGEIRQVMIGGAPLNRNIEQFLVQIKFPFTVGYGMTECAPLISYSTPEEFVPGSCGRIVPHMEVRIDSPEPATIPGEILAKGDHVMAGYLTKDKKDDKRVIDGDWLHTGDIGTLDADNVLRIKGRMETLIKLPDGTTIYPEEIEARLNVMDGIMESLVEWHNGRLSALVVPDYEYADAMGLGLSEIRDLMSSNLEQLNTSLDNGVHISELILYPSEFEKTPKLSIRRYKYAK